MDRGFDLAGVLEDLEGLSQLTDMAQAGQAAMACVAAFLRAEKELLDWHARLQIEALLPLPWPVAESGHDHQVPPEQPQTNSGVIQVHLFQQYTMMQLFWTWLLIVKAGMTILASKMPNRSASPNAINKYGPDAQLYLVGNIVRLTVHSTDGEPWAKPAARSILPIGLALYAARMHAGDEAARLTAECESLLETFSGALGIKHAGAVLRAPGAWQHK